MISKSKKLPHFSAYIEVMHGKNVSRRNAIMMPWLFGLIAATFAVATGLAFALPKPANWIVSTIFTTVSVIAIPFVCYYKAHYAVPKDRFLAHREEVINKFVNSLNAKRLHKDLDPTAAQLAEASAFYWNQIRTRLDMPLWTSPPEGSGLMVSRAQILQAADDAMSEQLFLVVRCLLDKGKRNPDWKDALEDAIGVDVEDWLDRIRGNEDKVFHPASSAIGEIFDQSRRLAESLKALSIEVDQMTHKSVMTAQATSGGAVDHIDATLKHLQELRQAERELDGEVDAQTQNRV